MARPVCCSPIPCHAGGISEMRKIATMAEVYYAGLAPHNPYGPVATAVAVHIDLASPNFVIQEMIDPESAPEAQALVEGSAAGGEWAHPAADEARSWRRSGRESRVPKRTPDFSIEKAGGMAMRYYHCHSRRRRRRGFLIFGQNEPDFLDRMNRMFTEK